MGYRLAVTMDELPQRPASLLRLLCNSVMSTRCVRACVCMCVLCAYMCDVCACVEVLIEDTKNH